MLDWWSMQQTRTSLIGVYVDGETKTGKGAAGQAIADALRNEGLDVYYDVAGNFFRRYVAIVRQQLGLGETASLPDGPRLEAAARRVYASRQPFRSDDTLGDLQRPAISESVAILGKLPLVQHAGSEWWAMTLRLANEAGAEVVVLDGRNPRNRVRDQTAETGIRPLTALELFMTCEPEVAARRSLLAKGILSPTPEQLAAETGYVVKRRDDDRHRAEKPFQLPAASVSFDITAMSPAQAVAAAWQDHGSVELPVTITLNNTHLAMTDMLAAVTQLAGAAIDKVRPAAQSR